MGQQTGTAKLYVQNSSGAWTPVSTNPSTAFPLPVAGLPSAVYSSNITTTDVSAVGLPSTTGGFTTGAPTNGSYVNFAMRNSDSSVTVSITGLTSGTLYFEGTFDGTNYVSMAARQLGNATSVPVTVTSANGLYAVLNPMGFSTIRVRSIGALTGTPAVFFYVGTYTSSAPAVTVANALPAGSNSIGQVTLSGASTASPSSGVLTAAVAVNTTVTTTTAQVTASVATAGNLTFHVATAAFVGTLVFEGSIDGGLNWAPMICIREDGSGADNSVALAVTSVFVRQYTVALAGYTHFKVRCSTFTSGTGAVYMVPGPFLIEPNPSLAAGSQLVGSVTLTSTNAAALGIAANYNPYGTLRVTVEPTTVFMDPFDGSVIDTNRWTAAGTQTPTQNNGAVTLAPTVGASVANNATLISTMTFTSPGVSFLTFSDLVTLEATQTNAVNVHRYWGKGQVTSFTYATPVTDGVGFEVEGTVGALQCVVYIGGTKYVVNSTTPALISSSIPGFGGGGTAFPTGATGSNYGKAMTWLGGQHRYAVMIRSDVIYWFAEGVEVPVAVLAYAIPNVQGLPIRIHSITNNAATSLANTFMIGAQAVNDNSAQNHTISDGAYQHRKVGVSPASHMKVAPYSSTPGQTSPGMTTASATVLAANVNRIGAAFTNDPNSASSVYVLLGATASLTAFTVIVAPGGYYEVPYGYAGTIAGICSTGTATMRVTELTP